MKGPWKLRNLRNTIYLNAINISVSCAEASSVKSSANQLVRKKGKNLEKQVLALLKVAQARHAVKVKLPKFSDNTQQDTHEFLMKILPVLQLPRYQWIVSRMVKCKS